MKLYLWREVFADYTDGCAFAIAASKEEAAVVAVAGQDRFRTVKASDSPLFALMVNELLGSPCEEHELDKPFGFAIEGGS